MRLHVLAHLQTLRIYARAASTNSDVLATLPGLLCKMSGLRELQLNAKDGDLLGTPCTWLRRWLLPGACWRWRFALEI